jgi:hypothetical protein
MDFATAALQDPHQLVPADLFRSLDFIHLLDGLRKDGAETPTIA